MNLISLSLWANRILAASALIALFVTKDVLLTSVLLGFAMVLYLLFQSLSARFPQLTADLHTQTTSLSGKGTEYRNLQRQLDQHQRNQAIDDEEYRKQAA